VEADDEGKLHARQEDRIEFHLILTRQVNRPQSRGRSSRKYDVAPPEVRIVGEDAVISRLS
jgi:hypothetical protein